MRKQNQRRDKPRSASEIRRILRRRLPELAARHKVKSLALFGSYVRGKQSARSDLDLLVEFSEPPNLFEFMDLEEHLAALVGVKVDLVTKGALKGNIGKHILDEVVAV